MSSEFLHITIDLSLRQIIAPDDKTVLICQIDSNVPIKLWHDIEEAEQIYSIGKALDENNTLYLDIAFFVLMIKRCADSMCFCVVAYNDVEEPIYHIKCIEQGNVVSDDIPNGTVGKVSKGCRHEFALKVGNLTQTFRIETIPSEDDVLGKSKLIYRETGGDS